MLALFINPLLAVKLINVFRYLASMIIFSWTLPQRTHFRLRLTGSIVVCFLAAVGIPILSDSIFYITTVFLVLCLVCMLCIRVCWNTDWQVTFFIASAAFSCEHIASMTDSLVSLAAPDVLNYVRVNHLNPWIVLNYTVCFVLAVSVIYYLIFRNLKLNDHHNLSFSAMLLLLCISLAVNLYLNLVFSRLTPNRALIESTFEYVANILVSAFLLSTQIGMLRENQMETRLQMTSMLWEQAREQYRISKDTIEIINIKSHDLKHRLLALKDKTSENEYADIMEAIDSYGSQIETGNEVLDVIFQEKNLICRKRGIQFACIIDGAALNYMDHTDLYVLFGNLIDNAIEAVSRMPDTEVKSIQASVYREKGFVIISTENGYDGQLKWSGGRLHTSKEDKQNHGYGMLSIENIVHKYGGRYTIKTEDQIFSICITLPVSYQKTDL